MFSLAFLGQASKSRALAIANNGVAVFETDGPPMDWRDMPPGRPERALTLLLNNLADKAKVSLNDMQTHTSSCAFGMSGLEKRIDTSRLDTWVRENGLSKAKIRTLPLSQACHIGAFLGKPGVMIRCGHGSCVFAVGGNGHESIKGGWGGIISDQGSGAWLGRQALISTLRTIDGIALASEIEFVEKLAKFERCDNLISLVKVLNGKEELLHVRKFLNHIGRTVCQIAANGDPYADRLTLRAHSHLSSLVKAAVTDLHYDAQLAVCLRGGIVETQPTFIVGLMDRLCREVKQIQDMLGLPNGHFGPLVGVGLAALGFDSNLEADHIGEFIKKASTASWGHAHLRTFPEKQSYMKAGGQ